MVLSDLVERRHAWATIELENLVVHNVLRYNGQFPVSIIEPGNDGDVISTVGGETVWAPGGGGGLPAGTVGQILRHDGASFVAEDEILQDNIPAFSISTPKIIDGAVTSIKIQDEAVTLDKIAPEGLEGEVLKIVGGDVVWDTESGGLPSGTINQILIHDGADFIASDQFVDSNFPTNPTISGNLTVVGSINAGSITGDVDLSDVVYPGANLNDVIVYNGSEFVAQPQITIGNIPINSIDNPKLQSNSVSTVKIQDNAVSTNKIQDDAVNGDKLADLSVDTDHLVDGSVTEPKIASGAVTEDKIGTNAVTTVKIQDDAVNGDKIADLSVGTAHIVDGSVTEVKIGTDAVTEDKIGTDAVTTVKIQDDAVTSDKLATNSVSTIKIQNGAVTEDKIDDDAVTTDKILDANVTPAKLSAGANGQVLQTIGGVPTWFTYSVESYFAKTGGTPLAAGAGTRITYTDPSILNPLGLSNISGVISGFDSFKFYLIRFKCLVNDFTNGDNITMVLRQETAPNNSYDTYRNDMVMILAGTVDDVCVLEALVDGSAIPSGISVFVSAKTGSMTVTDPRLSIRKVN